MRVWYIEEIHSDAQVEETLASTGFSQPQTGQERAAAAERAFAAAEDKVIELTRQLAAARLNEGEQPPEMAELKRRVADLQADRDDKVCIAYQHSQAFPCPGRPCFLRYSTVHYTYTSLCWS